MYTLLFPTLVLATPAPGTVAPLQSETRVPASTASTHARLHPEAPTIYVEMSDIQGLTEAYGQSSYGRLSADPEFRETLAAVMGEDAPPPEVPVTAWVTGLFEDEETEDLLVLVDGLRAASFSAILPGGSPIEMLIGLDRLGGEEAAKHLSLQLQLEYGTPEAAGDAIEALWMLMGGENGDLRLAEAEEVPEGVDGTLMIGSDADPLLATTRLLQHGSHVVVTMGTNSPAAFLARHQNPSTDPLRAGRGTFAAARGIPVVEVHNGLDDALVQLLAMEATPVLLPLVDLIEGMGGPLMTMVLKGGDWRVTLDQGRFVTDGFHAHPSNPLSRIFASGPLDPAAVHAVPADAALAWVASFDAEAAERWVVNLMGGDPAALEAMEAEHGFRPDRDLIAPLGNAITWSMGPSISVLSAPPLRGTILLEDAETFRRGLDGMITLLEKEAADSFEIATRKYRRVPIHTLRFASSGGMSALPFDPSSVLSPSIVVLDDRVLITLSSQQARRAVRAFLNAEPGDERHPVLGNLELVPGATEVAYADWMGILGTTYDSVRQSILPMLVGNMPDDGPNLDDLPESELFRSYWSPSMRWKRATDVGVAHHAESSFGPEGLFLPAAAVFLLGAQSTSEELLVAPEAPEGR